MRTRGALGRGSGVSPGSPAWQCAQPVLVFGSQVGGGLGGSPGGLQGCSLLAPPREGGVSLLQLTPLGKWSTSPFPPPSLSFSLDFGALYVPSPVREKATPLDQL